MRRLAVVGLLGLFGLLALGCASGGGGSNADRRLEVAREEVAKMAAPSKKLSSYASYEMLPMEMSEGVLADEKKVDWGNQLDTSLRGKLTPLLSQWESDGQAGSGALKIVPVLNKLRIVSGGARVWLGAWAGNSEIDMGLRLVDAATGDVIAEPSVARAAGGVAGAWSGGSTDRNLVNYIVDIGYQYLVENY